MNYTTECTVCHGGTGQRYPCTCGIGIQMEIHNAIAAYTMTTGGNATKIYLGHNQMNRLISWAAGYDLYVRNTKVNDSERRLEMHGCLIYQVNADDHCFAG